MTMNQSIDAKELNSKFPWGIAIFSYLMSFGLIFTFFGAYFWDDWYTSFTLNGAEAKVYWDGYSVQSFFCRSSFLATSYFSF
jgi:hypothetical protein